MESEEIELLYVGKGKDRRKKFLETLSTQNYKIVKEKKEGADSLFLQNIRSLIFQKNLIYFMFTLLSILFAYHLASAAAYVGELDSTSGEIQQYFDEAKIIMENSVDVSTPNIEDLSSFSCDDDKPEVSFPTPNSSTNKLLCENFNYTEKIGAADKSLKKDMEIYVYFLAFYENEFSKYFQAEYLRTENIDEKKYYVFIDRQLAAIKSKMEYLIKSRINVFNLLEKRRSDTWLFFDLTIVFGVLWASLQTIYEQKSKGKKWVLLVLIVLVMLLVMVIDNYWNILFST